MLSTQVEGPGLIVSDKDAGIAEGVESYLAQERGLFEPAGDVEPVAG
ncbi:hypothetical protein [Corynebacterium sp. HMSC077B05]|nr:hypothetical protein [Corynebacterium sp. HMSC077B05]